MKDLSVSHISLTKVNLKWTLNNEGNRSEKIMGYAVQHYRNDDESTQRTYEVIGPACILLSGLQPKSSYTIWIAPFKGYKMAFPTKFLFQTLDRLAMPEADVIVEVNRDGRKHFKGMDTRVIAKVSCRVADEMQSVVKIYYRKMNAETSAWTYAMSVDPSLELKYHHVEQLYYPNKYQVKCVNSEANVISAGYPVTADLEIPIPSNMLDKDEIFGDVPFTGSDLSHRPLLHLLGIPTGS
jgi:hypothetical protein